ncbi:WD repeat-containing protein 88-like [Scomber scombrus]|uniref:WD repeat-containing protein 88-like n=1 Tax=Scomber scombrus TaxID=13677 RepID=A0AAV1QIE6_SCOSC
MAAKNIDPLSVDEPTGGEEEEDEKEEEEQRGAEWSKKTQVPVKQLRAHREAVTAARLCFNDSFLLSCSSDTTAVLWDVESCRPRRLFSGVHEKPVSECAVIPNSNR